MSIPINLSSPGDETPAAPEEKGVKGRYASVERILELPDDKIEWRMATASSAGGLIPQFLTDFALPEAVSKVILNTLAVDSFLMVYPLGQDVPLFLKWMKMKKATSENTT